jgi:hypothetical protein
MKEKYLYAVYNNFSLTEKPFTTKSKKELILYLGKHTPTLVNEWFADGSFIKIYDKKYVIRLVIPCLKERGIGRGEHLKKN